MSYSSSVKKIVGETEIKCDGRVFHELFRYKPYHLPNIIPDIVEGCHLLQGEWGTVGSIILWNFVHERKKRASKDIIEGIDEEKKLVSMKVIEGDLLELYKSFIVTIEVDSRGETNLARWTFEYEKLNEDIPDPISLMDLHTKLNKDIDNYYLQ